MKKIILVLFPSLLFCQQNIGQLYCPDTSTTINVIKCISYTTNLASGSTIRVDPLQVTNIGTTGAVTLLVTPAITNNSPVNLYVNGVGYGEILKNGSSLASGDLVAGNIYPLAYANGNFSLINSSAGSGTPSGSAGGDLSGTYPNPSVAKINGSIVPLSASVLGTNSSRQLVSGSAQIPVIACIGTPGNTTGSYLGQCQTTAGALYTCNNAAGCTVAGDWVAQQPAISAYPTVTDASPIAWNLGSAAVTNGLVTLAHTTGTRALNITNPAIGGFYTLIVKQDSTGGAAMTGGTGCTWLTPGGLGSGAFPIANTASAVNVISFTYDGSKCLMVPAAAYSAM